jgi:hypothetical protein
VKALLFILLVAISFSCQSSAPVRDFVVTLYETDYQCLEFEDNNGQIVITCRGDNNHPDKVVGIRFEDYLKERNFQKLLINRCDKWKK